PGLEPGPISRSRHGRKVDQSNHRAAAYSQDGPRLKAGMTSWVEAFRKTTVPDLSPTTSAGLSCASRVHPAPERRERWFCAHMKPVVLSAPRQVRKLA